MKRFLIAATLFSISLLVASTAAAQQEAPDVPTPSTPAQTQEAGAKVTLHGMVRTSRGIAVPGATVRIRNVESGEGWETTTDEEGKFAVPDVPAGKYHIEAQQLGIGAATWDDEVKAASGQQPAVPESIDLRLRRKAVLEQQGAAEPQPAGATHTAGTPEVANNSAGDSTDTAETPKKHHKAHAASDSADGAAAATGESAEEAAPKSKKTQAAANAAPATTSAGKPSKAPKSQKGGFEQVEPAGILTANADPIQQSASSVSQGAGDTSQSPDAYLISGAVGRGSTAEGLDANGQDDLSATDNAADVSSSSSVKKPKHQGSGHTHKSKSASGPADNLSGSVADLTVRNTIKHLGSNQMHATFYSYYDSSVWDARPYAIKGGPADKVAHFGERFGVNVGGPLTIPKIYDGRDRTFWFANYQLNRNTNPVNIFANMPTVQERTGNFCDRLDPTGQPLQLFDPMTGSGGPRQSFGCSIPTDRIDSSALKQLALIPLPNLPGFNLNYLRAARAPQAIDLGNFRVLQTLSPRFNISGIFNILSARGEVLTAYPALNGNSDTRDQNTTVTFTQNWSPRLLNETKINFNRNRAQTLSTNAFLNDVAAQDGVTGVSTAPIDFGAPELSFTDIQPLTDPGPILVRNQTLRFMDDLSYTLPRHTLRFGAEIRRRQLNIFNSPTPRGIFYFTGLQTSQLDASGLSVPNTGFDFADFLLGLPQSTEVQFGTSSNYGRQWQFVTYAQDDWRIKPRFSVNFGLRYEYFTPFVEKNNHLATLVIDPNITQVAVAVPGQAATLEGTLPNSLVRPNYANLAPRIGIAWRPFRQGGPVVRAGYGIFYNGAVLDQLYTKMLNQPPWAQAREIVTSNSQLLTLENGFPTSLPDTLTNTAAVDPNYQIGYAQIWNLSIEQQFGNQYVFEFLYTGTKGTHLDLVSDPNQATPGSVAGQDQRRRIPNASGFTYESSGADSIYNGMEIRMQRRMSNGMRFLFLYTLGHSIDDASSIGVGQVTGMVQDFNNLRAERGNSFFDIRNEFRTTFGYDLPFGDRRRWLRSGFGSKLLGNWEVMGTTIFSSGNHITPFITAQNSNGVGPLFSQRPDLAGDPNLPASQRTTTRFYNVAAFQLPVNGQFGNAPRGSIVGPSLFNVNLAIERRLHFGRDKKYTLQIRWEAQNFTNSANFANVINIVDAADAGLITGAKPMRTMDIFMRVHF
jgi:Carboxypeptidase regulatory-like domain/TonB dependent receptor-like, beta-barrel